MSMRSEAGSATVSSPVGAAPTAAACPVRTPAQSPNDGPRAVQAMLSGLIISAAMWLGTRPIGDQSAFLHLSIARQLLHGDGFGKPDPWAPSAAHAYVATEWLPALAAYGLNSLAGLAGVAWLLCAGILAVLAVTFWTARRVADAVPALLVTGAFMVGANHALTPRPQLLGLILLGVSVHAWWRSAEDLRPRWWLVPVTWLAACSHGLWLVGVGVGLITICGLAIDHRLSWPGARRLLIVPMASLGAAALTPLGPALLLTPFTVSSSVRDFVAEWQATSAHDLAALVTLAMTGLVAVGVSRSRLPLPWWQVAHLGSAVFLTLAMQRTIAVGALLVAPLMAQTLQHWRESPVTPAARHAVPALAVGLVALLLLAAPLAATRAGAPTGVPSALSADLDRIPAGTTILEDANISAWVRWTHPSLHAVQDSRSEIFSRKQHLGYARLMAAAPGWQPLLQRTSAAYALVLSDSPIAAALQERANWHPIKAGLGWSLLGAPGTEQNSP